MKLRMTTITLWLLAGSLLLSCGPKKTMPVKLFAEKPQAANPGVSSPEVPASETPKIVNPVEPLPPKPKTLEELLQSGEYGPWLNRIGKLVEAGQDPLRIENLKKQVRDNILNRLDYQALRAAYPLVARTRFPANLLAARLAKLAYHIGDFGTARQVADDFLARNAKHPYRSAIEQVRQWITKQSTANPRVLGVLVPLSGRGRYVGKAILKGIKLAAAQTPGLVLRVKDTHGNPGETRQAVTDLVEKDQVIGIIGPIGIRESLAAAASAERYGVPIILLTPVDRITELGPYVFRNFLTNATQARGIARYAIETLGLKRFAIFHPQTRNGRELANYFWKEVVKLGGEIRAAQSYPQERENLQRYLNEPIQKMVGRYYMELRPDYWNKRRKLKYIKKRLAKKRYLERIWRDLPPKVDFQALFIPEHWSRLKYVIPYLRYWDIEFFTENIVRKDRLKLKYGKKLPELVYLLGTNGWNDDQLHKTIGDLVWRAIFCDAYYKQSSQGAFIKFAQLFYSRHRRHPHYLHAVAYDSFMIMAGLLSQTNVPTRKGLRDLLLTIKDYNGASGKTTFKANGDVDKELYYLAVSRKKVTGNISEYEIVPADKVK